MANQNIYLQASAATPASELTRVEGGKNGAIISVDSTIGAETVEIKELRGTSYESVTDPTDFVSTTSKLLNSSLSSRTIDAGFRGAQETSGAAIVYVYLK